MMNRRDVLRTIGISGVITLSGCTGSDDDGESGASYPSGNGKIELVDQSIEQGASELTRRMNEFSIEVPKDDWAQIHLNLSQYATVGVGAVADVGRGTIHIMRRREWSDFVDDSGKYRGFNMEVSESGDSTRSETIGVMTNPKLSIAPYNYDSEKKFEAIFYVGEEVDIGHSYRDDIVVETSEVYE